MVTNDIQLRERLSTLLGGYGLIEDRYEHCVQALGDEEISAEELQQLKEAIQSAAHDNGPDDNAPGKAEEV